ncbi:MAG: prepilin peptidase [Rhodobacteraceae bacterium]|nr:prepilin peptidase [Paracoccaceae bacterium]
MMHLFIPLAIVLIIVAAFYDLLTMTIPNWVSIALVVCFLAVAGFSAMPLQQFLLAVGAAAIVLAVTFAFFAFGWMGGGDAKLLSSLTLWFGWSEDLTSFLMLTCIYGAVLTFALIIFRKFVLLPAFLAKMDWLARLSDSMVGIPYGIAISVAALQVFANSPWVKSLGYF